MPNSKIKSGFTLIELLTVIAIIALLAAILFPVFSRVRESARKSSCQSNLKQIGLGLMQYSQDYDERTPYDFAADQVSNSNSTIWPPSGTATAASPDGIFDSRHWPGLCQPYVKSEQIFTCPSGTPNATTPGAMSYWGNGSYFIKPTKASRALSDIALPAQTAVTFDSPLGDKRDQLVMRLYLSGGTFWTDGSSFNSLRNGVHNETHNVLYADGHVKAIKFDQLKTTVFCLTDGRQLNPATGVGDPTKPCL